jgi:Integrase zinc binding domain
VSNATRWYHPALGHIGARRLLDTIQLHFYAPGLQQHVENITGSCDACQRMKQPGRPYGFLAAREAGLLPWNEVAVDSIGPWTLKVGNQRVEFKALTMIDTVSNSVELVRFDNGTAAHAGLLGYLDTRDQQLSFMIQAPNSSVATFSTCFKGMELVPGRRRSRTHKQMPFAKECTRQ